MNEVKDLLDDAAARATRGLLVDPGAALASAHRRHADAVRRRARGAVAVAAVAALVFVASQLPHAVPLKVQPGGTAVGLPQRWWAPDPWVPSVTDAPIEHASVVIDAYVMYGEGAARGTGRALVSSDGTQYRRLPAGAREAQLVALSPDGRWLAWARGLDDQTGTGPQTVQLLRLADGLRHDVVLPDTPPVHPVEALVWTATGLWASSTSVRTGTGSAESGGDIPSASWLVDPVVGTVTPRRRGPGVVAVGADGTAYTPPQTRRGTGTVPLWGRAPGECLTLDSPVYALAPDAAAWTCLGQLDDDGSVRRLLVVQPRGGPRRSVRLDLGDGDLTLLGWSGRGVVMAQDEGNGDEGARRTPSLVVADPRTGRTTTLGTPQDDYGAGVVAAAGDLVASGVTVPGAEPHPSRWTRDGITYALFAEGWVILAPIVVAAGLVLTIRVLRRPRSGPRPAGRSRSGPRRP